MLLNRVAELVIGQPDKKAVLIRDLRFFFHIHKDSDKNANQLTLKIFNMNTLTRQRVEQVNNRIILKAGYGDLSNAFVIFTGSVTRVLTTKQQKEIITELSASDGLLPMRNSQASLSYTPKTSAITILHDIIKLFGLTAHNLPTQLTDKLYPKGYAFAGKTVAAMDEVCAYLGVTWSIQNNMIQILLKDMPVEDKLIVLTPDNGLLEIPTRLFASTRNHTQGDPTDALILREQNIADDHHYQIEGYRVKALLQPRIYPGCYVGLESKALQLKSQVSSTSQRARAFFRAEVVTHHGDTYQGEWITECELKALRGHHGGKS